MFPGKRKAKAFVLKRTSTWHGKLAKTLSDKTPFSSTDHNT